MCVCVCVCVFVCVYVCVEELEMSNEEVIKEGMFRTYTRIF